MNIIKEAEEIFGEMRDTTPEEQASINTYIKSISKDTGVNIFDLLDKEEQYACNKSK